jgi:TM2 domain-containing membrane protein YozV
VSAGKDVGVAYLLWFFLGGLGGHHFYLNRPATGIALASMSILGWCTLWFFFVGLIFLVPVGIWWLVDAFLVSGWVREHNARAAHGLPQ